jgi:hypothetical protein
LRLKLNYARGLLLGAKRPLHPALHASACRLEGIRGGSSRAAQIPFFFGSLREHVPAQFEATSVYTAVRPTPSNHAVARKLLPSAISFHAHNFVYIYLPRGLRSTKVLRARRACIPSLPRTRPDCITSSLTQKQHVVMMRSMYTYPSYGI